MAITYELIDKNNGGLIGRGISEYKSHDRFIDFELFGDNTDLNKYFKEGHIVDVYIDGVFDQRWKKVSKANFGMWDNLEADAPERMEAIEKVVDMLKEDSEVEVSFSYNGRTRHATAARAFRDSLKELGHNYIYIIGDNYEFKVVNK